MKKICAIAWVVLFALNAWSQQSARTYRISGKAVDGITGAALPHALITVGPTTQQNVATQSVIAGDDGSFSVDGLPEGKWVLSGQAHGFAPQNFGEHGVFSVAIAVGPEKNSEGLLFRLRPSSSISGTVTDEEGEVVRNANVNLYRMGADDGVHKTTVQRQHQTDDLGRYRFSNLAPGSYFVVVETRPWYAQEPEQLPVNTNPPPVGGEVHLPLDVIYPVTLYPGVTDPNQATPLLLKAGEHATADVSLTAVPALHLRIGGLSTDPAEGFGANLTQRLFDRIDISVTASVRRFNATGEIEIENVPPGELELSVNAFRGIAGQPPEQRHWRQAIDMANSAEIAIGAENHPMAISGTLEMEGGGSAAGIFVSLRNNATNVAIGGSVDDKGKGEFEIQDPDVAAGTYTVIVSQGAVRSLTASGAKVRGQEVEIGGAGPVRLNVEVTKKLGQVDGTALRDGKTQAGAMIMLVPRDLKHNTSLVRRDESDSDGTFTLYNVVPGKYTVIALADGFDMEWTDPEVIVPYLAGGEVVEVGAGKTQLEVRVQ